MDFPTFYIFVDEDFLAPGGILNGIWGPKPFQDLIFVGFVLPDLQHFRLLDRFSPGRDAAGNQKRTKSNANSQNPNLTFSSHHSSCFREKALVEASRYNYSRTEFKFKPFFDDTYIREETPF
jgi:hypothetical protein